MTNDETYWGTAKIGQKYVDVGPFSTRRQARDEARKVLKGRAAIRG